jgi:NifU-like protein involved in Fe-S cluster formation
MHIYINIRDGIIEDIKYLCTCDPTANVVVEILCTLAKGRTIEVAEALNEASFTGVLGGGEEEFLKKTRGIIELLKRGIARYKSKAN